MDKQDQRCQRYWSQTLRHIGLRNAGIGKCIPEIFFPDNRGPAYLVTNAMMVAPVKVVDESPIEPRRVWRELYPKVDGAVKSRFHTGVGVLMMVYVYFTRPTDWGIV